MSAHEMLLVALEERGSIEIRCTDAEHDFSRTVLTPGDVVQARHEHDESQESLRAPGFYLAPGVAGMQPPTYRKDHDGRWWSVQTWARASAPTLGTLGFAGDLPEVFDR